MAETSSPAMNSPFHVRVRDVTGQAPAPNNLASVIHALARITLEYYEPGTRGDLQQPHESDEYYVVAKGSANLQCGQETFDLTRGDLAFVPARQPHRFVGSSADFAVWVFLFEAT